MRRIKLFDEQLNYNRKSVSLSNSILNAMTKLSENYVILEIFIIFIVNHLFLAGVPKPNAITVKVQNEVK